LSEISPFLRRPEGWFHLLGDFAAHSISPETGTHDSYATIVPKSYQNRLRNEYREIRKVQDVLECKKGGKGWQAIDHRSFSI